MQHDDVRLTGPTLKVLGALLAGSNELAGVEIGKSMNLLPGTLYPILARLERAGWVTSRWESENLQNLMRPRKRFYILTGMGAAKARAAFREIMPTFEGFAIA